MTSVYPEDFVNGVLGERGALAYNQSIELWAIVLGNCTIDNSESFRPNEWRDLLTVLHDAPYPEATFIPVAQYLGSKLNRAADEHEFPSVRGLALRKLAEKVVALDFAHAHALLWSVQWAAKYQNIDVKNDPWWTLAFRKNFCCR